MQTKNPNSPGIQIASPSGSGKQDIKSFSALKDAVLDQRIEEFVAAYRQGLEGFDKAGKVLIELSRERPDIFRLINNKHPWISHADLQVICRIGRGEILPQWLLDQSLGAKKMLECTYDVQKEYLDKPVEVAVSWKNGEIKTAQKKICELSKSETAIVFDNHGGINNMEQQAFRLRNPKGKEEQKLASPVAPRMTSVDVGYFSISVQEDGSIKCEKCGKSALAQPVRVIENGKGFKTAVVVYYKQVNP